VALALASVVIDHHDLAGTGNDDLLALRAGDIAHGAGKAHRAVALGLHRTLHRRTRSGATDVEGAHRELRTRFADRLGGNHANRLASIDQNATSEVAAIALGADAVARVAGQRRAHLDLVDAQFFDQIHRVFIEQVPHGKQDVLGFGMNHVDRNDAAQDAVTQRLDDFAALDQRSHGNAVACAAIVFGNNQILGHVDQAAREVAGIGRF
jgi:hypothetical protein